MYPYLLLVILYTNRTHFIVFTLHNSTESIDMWVHLTCWRLNIVRYQDFFPKSLIPESTLDTTSRNDYDVHWINIPLRFNQYFFFGNMSSFNYLTITPHCNTKWIGKYLFVFNKAHFLCTHQNTLLEILQLFVALSGTYLSTSLKKYWELFQIMEVNTHILL